MRAPARVLGLATDDLITSFVSIAEAFTESRRPASEHSEAACRRGVCPN